MTSYSYYNSLPQWGTSQFQQMPPPAPRYQPTPSWSGADYFSAHSGNRDNSIFDYVWHKMRDFVLGTGFGRKQAFHWWKRIYSGLVDPSLTLPKEIGAAAGYEAVRLWETHSSVYASPLNADREREREALVGLAAAEATKLWAYTGRLSDKWGRLEASETAGATASRIFVQTYGYDSANDSYTRFPRMNNSSRRSSRRRVSVSPIGRRRPQTPYRPPSVVDAYSSPVPSFGNDAFNMAGMSANLPNSPYLSAPVARTPLRSPSPLSLGRMGQSYLPPADDFPNDYDGYDDYEGSLEPYDENYDSYGNFGGMRRGRGGYDGMRSGGYGGMGPGNYGSMGSGGYEGMSPGDFGEMGLSDYAELDGFGGMGSDGLSGFGSYDGPGFASNYPTRGRGGFGGSNLGYGDPMLGEGQGYDVTGPMGYNNGLMATPSNVTYDPILGPGIKGTYYPKVAQMQQLSRSGYNNYPGASVGLPPPPSLNRGWSRGGLRRTRSFY